MDKIKEDNTRARIVDSNMAEHFNYRLQVENKLRELEIENRNNYDAKQKFEIELRVLQERHNDMKKNYEINQNELNTIKIKQNEGIMSLESKLIKLNQEMEFLQRENNTLRINEERIRVELTNVEKHRDSINEKYQDVKSQNNILNSRLIEVKILLNE